MQTEKSQTSGEQIMRVPISVSASETDVRFCLYKCMYGYSGSYVLLFAFIAVVDAILRGVYLLGSGKLLLSN